MTKKMKATLQNTVFKDADVVAVSANPGGQETELPLPQGKKINYDKFEHVKLNLMNFLWQTYKIS